MALSFVYVVDTSGYGWDRICMADFSGRLVG